jgi:hypothetical protein
MTGDCGNKRDSFDTSAVLGKTVVEIIALSGTAHSLGSLALLYPRDSKKNQIGKEKFQFTSTRYHMELDLANTRNEAAYELSKHFPANLCGGDQHQHIDFAENTIYHPSTDLLKVRQIRDGANRSYSMFAREDQGSSPIYYEIRPSGTLDNDELYWIVKHSEMEELDEDLRYVGCSPTLQVVNTLEWARLNIDKLEHENIRHRLFYLLFGYGNLDKALADNGANTLSMMAAFLNVGFNTYRFATEDLEENRRYHSNNGAFLWLCRVQHALRRYVELSARLYQLNLSSASWPDVRAIILPYLTAKTTRDDLVACARIILASYQFTSQLNDADVQVILQCRIILQLNPYDNSSLREENAVNELDFVVDQVWLQHRDQIRSMLLARDSTELSKIVNGALSKILMLDTDIEWSFVDNKLQSKDARFIIDLQKGFLIKDNRLAVDKLLWLTAEYGVSNWGLFKKLGLDFQHLSLIDNGTVVSKKHRGEMNSVVTANGEWEFLYYGSDRQISSVFRNIKIDDTLLHFCLLEAKNMDHDDKITEYFKTHKINNPFAHVDGARSPEYNYFVTEDDSTLFVIQSGQSDSAYLYRAQHGWLHLNRQNGQGWLPDNQVLLDFSCPHTSLEQEWADRLRSMVGFAGVEAKGQIVGDDTCEITEINFSALGLHFHNQKGRLESYEFPGYYLSDQRSIQQLNGLPSIIILSNDAGMQKFIVPVFSLISGDDNCNFAFERTDIVSPGKLVNHNIPYYQYDLSRDGELRGDSVGADLYLAIIYRSQGDYQRAMQCLSRTYHQYNNSVELRALSELLTQHQDQTPLGAAFDCKVALRMLAHMQKWAKKSDEWIGEYYHLPALVNHALRQYYYYLETVSCYRDGINIIPEYLQLTELEAKRLGQLIEIVEEKQKSGGLFGYESPPPKQRQVCGGFMTERLMAIETMQHLEDRSFSTYFSHNDLEKIVSEMWFDDQRHHKQTDTRQPFLRIYHDENNQAQFPGLEYLQAHFVDFFEEARSADKLSIIRLRYELFCLLQNDAFLETRHKHLLSTLVFVLNHPENFRDLPKVTTAKECYENVIEQCHRMLDQKVENHCVLIQGYAPMSDPVSQQSLPNPYQRAVQVNFDVSGAQLSLQCQQPLAVYVEQYFVKSSKAIVERTFPLEESGLQNISKLERTLLNHYREGHAENLAKSEQVYEFSKEHSVAELRDNLMLRRVKNNKTLKELHANISHLLNYTPLDEASVSIADCREAYLLKALYGGEQIIPPNLDDLMSALLNHDVTRLHEKNYFLSQKQINILHNMAMNFALLQSENDQIGEALGIIGDSKAADQFDHYTLQLLGRTIAKPREYDIRKYPEFLMYEYFTKRMLRPDQIKPIVNLIEYIESGVAIDSECYRHALLQFAAGGGKTAVMIPILAQRFARNGWLPIIFNTNELYSIGVQEIPLSLRQSFQQQMEVIEREIDHTWTKEELMRLLQDLKQWRQEHKCILIKSITWYSIHTAKKLAYAHNNEDLGKAAADVLAYLKKYGIKLEDEGHLISDPLQESIKTYGPMQTIPITQQELFLAFYDYLMGRIEGSAQVAKLAGIIDKGKTSVSAKDLLEVQQQLADYIIKQSAFSSLNLNDLREYILQKDRNRPKWLQMLHSSNPAIADLVVLARAFIKMHLPHILSLQYKKDYGVSIHKGDLTVAPKHDCKDVTSHFSDQMLVMALTIQLYEQQGVPTEYVQKIIEQLKVEHIQERKWNHGVTMAEQFFNSVINAPGDAHSLDGITDAEIMLYSCDSKIAMHPKMIRRFLLSYALPQIRTPKYRVVSTPADLQAGFERSIIFTATPGLHETYPVILDEANCSFDKAFESHVIYTLLSPKNSRACLIDMSQTPTQFFQKLQAEFPEMFAEMTALIDRGALLSNNTAKQVIKELLAIVGAKDKKSTAVFFDEQHMQISSENDTRLNVAVIGTRINETLQRYGIKAEELLLFLFLDLSKTTGTDVKRPYNDRAGLTVGKEQTVTEIVQAAMRERQLLADEAQQIIWIMFKSLYQQIDPEAKQFDLKQLFYWMIRNEAKQITTKVVMRAYQGIYQLIESAIWQRIHDGLDTYSQHANQLERTVDLSPYKRYELEFALNPPQMVLAGYIKELCVFFGISERALPLATQKYLQQIIAQASVLIEEMRYPHGAELKDEVYQEQQAETTQQQELVEEQKIKSLYDEAGYFNFQLEVYNESDQLDRVFTSALYDSKRYQLLSFTRCNGMRLPKLIFCKEHHSPIASSKESSAITFLKPIRMLLVSIAEGNQYQFLAITAAGGEFFAHEIDRLNSSAPKQTYAIIGQNGGVLYASNSFTKEQRIALEKSVDLTEMVIFMGLLNGQIVNPIGLVKMAKHYEWSQAQYVQLKDEIGRIHVSRHAMQLSNFTFADQPLLEDHNPIESCRRFPSLELDFKGVLGLPARVSNLHYDTVPESILPKIMFGKEVVPYVLLKFVTTEVLSSPCAMFAGNLARTMLPVQKLGEGCLDKVGPAARPLPRNCTGSPGVAHPAVVNGAGSPEVAHPAVVNGAGSPEVMPPPGVASGSTDWRSKDFQLTFPRS